MLSPKFHTSNKFIMYTPSRIKRDFFGHNTRVLVTAVTFLPSRCLATIGSITEPLPSNDRGIYRHTHTDSNVIL
jgi:hypothetical protein